MADSVAHGDHEHGHASRRRRREPRHDATADDRRRPRPRDCTARHARPRPRTRRTTTTTRARPRTRPRPRHGHTHGLVDESIKRSREGLRAVGLALLVLGATAVAQLVVFVASGSVALLADLIHNFGDAATAIPLAIAFALRSAKAERIAGLAGRARDLRQRVRRRLRGDRPAHQPAGAQPPRRARARRRRSASAATGGRRSSARAPGSGSTARRSSPTARTRAPTPTSASRSSPARSRWRSGSRSADPLIGLGITVVILKITRDSWVTVRAAPH